MIKLYGCFLAISSYIFKYERDAYMLDIFRIVCLDDEYLTYLHNIIHQDAFFFRTLNTTQVTGSLSVCMMMSPNGNIFHVTGPLWG